MIHYERIFLLGLSLVICCFSDVLAIDNVKTKKKYGAERSAIGQIKATIVAPVAATSSNDLRFGMIVKDNAGNVTIDEEGNRTTTGPGLATSGYSAGSIRLRGPRAQAVSVDIPEAHIYDNADNTVNVHSFTTNQDNSKLITLDAQNGKADIDVGASLNISDTDTQGGARMGVYRVQTSY